MDDITINVLHLKKSIGSDGATESILNIYEHLDREKIRFDFLVYSSDDNRNVRRITDLGGKVHYIPIEKTKIKFLRVFDRALELYRFLKENPYNVLHIDTDDPYRALELLIGKLAGVKVRIIHAHGIRNAENNKGVSTIKRAVQDICKKLISRTATDFFACSRSVAEWMFTRKVLESDRLKIIRNGIGVHNFAFNHKVRDKYRNLLGIQDKFVIGHVGRLVHVKNQEFLLEVFQEIYRQNPNIVLLIVGEGELERALKEKAQNLGLEKSVIFLGSRSDVAELMQAMDVFVLPSHYEGLGIVAIEAQAAGLKTICSNTVPQETKVTNLIEYLPLELGAEGWSKTIIKYQEGYKRVDTSSQIIKAGYDIKQIAKELERFYICRVKPYYNG